MSPADEPLSEFERNARAVLAESVQRIDARTRSRLNQARHAALAAAARPQRRWLGGLGLMPVAGAAVVVLAAVLLWHHPPAGNMGLVDGQHLTVEDMDLLADSEGLDLVEQGDGSGSFYEWAVAQADANGQSDG
ncbi:MAG: hypothetical protein JSR36_13350 [Proteobacteria bacterium]|nr:hypothetical protein [Pseudomonadota bacterium]